MMAYRFTNTDKWADAWFSNLKPNEKLLYIYLYENCDIAGFIELNMKRWGIDIGYNKLIIEGALKGLGRGLIYSDSKDCIFLRNFLKHQKNLPLTPDKNPAHRGIIRKFEEYKLKFNYLDIYEFIEGALKGLGSSLGNGNGLSNGLGSVKEEKVYKKNCLFKNSDITIKNIEEAFKKTNDIRLADPEYYFNAVQDWSAGKNEMWTDWIATARSFARNDTKDGKLKIRKIKPSVYKS